MDVTYYLAEAITGDVVQGVTLDVTSPDFARRLPGGTFTATVQLATDLDTLHQGDFTYLAALQTKMTPGAFTINPVVNGVSIGSWLIWRAEFDDVTSTVNISGFEWGLYPKYRDLERDYVYTNRDQGLVLYDLLTDCFKGGQAVDMFIPPTPVGQTVTMDQRYKTAKYGDVIDDQLPGMEWFVWARLDDATAPTKVLRDVIAVYGKRAQMQQVPLIAASPGSPGGSLLSWKRTVDYSKVAASLYGFGRGQGDAQVTADRVIPGAVPAGGLIVTKTVTFSQVEDKATLQALVDTEAGTYATAEEPIQASVNLDDFAVYPTPTDSFPVVLDARPSYPSGHTGRYRVGETRIRPTGDRPVIDLLMERI